MLSTAEVPISLYKKKSTGTDQHFIFVSQLIFNIGSPRLATVSFSNCLQLRTTMKKKLL